MVDWILWRCQMPDAQTLPQGLTRATKRYHSYPNRGGPIKILQTSELKKRKIHHTPRDDCFLLLEKCCFQFVWRNSTFCFCHFQKLPNLSAAFPTWQIYRIKWHHLFGSPLDQPVVAESSRAGRHGGEVVRKTQLEKHRRSLSTSQKTPGCKFQSSEATLCFFKR